MFVHIAFFFDILCLCLLSGALGRGYFFPSCGFPLLEGLPRSFFLRKCGLTSSKCRFKFAPCSAVCFGFVCFLGFPVSVGAVRLLVVLCDTAVHGTGV